MIGYVEISGFGANYNAGYIMWRTKKKKKHGYLISAVKIYKFDEGFNELPEPTQIKLELLFSHLYRLIKLHKIKSELDLEIFINGFMMEHKPALLYNARKHFECTHFNDEYMRTDMDSLTQIDKKYYIKKNKENVKELIKETKSRRKSD